MTQEKKHSELSFVFNHIAMGFSVDDKNMQMIWVREEDDAKFISRACTHFYHLLESLKEAKNMVKMWGEYADKYYQEKWDLKGNVEKLEQAIKAAEETNAHP